jgi:shikimate kinase
MMLTDMSKNQRMPMKTNLILIGMPGAGKSTVGVVLAKRLGMGYVDTDLLIQMRSGRLLQEIIDSDGLEGFRALEEQTLKEFDVCNAVVATGGSVVYSDAAMRHLGSIGSRVFLDVPLEELAIRLKDMKTRGLVIDPGATLADLYHERIPLYRKHADLTVDVAGQSLEQVVELICRELAET